MELQPLVSSTTQKGWSDSWFTEMLSPSSAKMGIFHDAPSRWSSPTTSRTEGTWGRAQMTTSRSAFSTGVLNGSGGCLAYEADPRHAEIAIKALGLEGSKPVATQGAKHERIDEENDPRLAGEYRMSYKCNVRTQRLVIGDDERPQSTDGRKDDCLCGAV